MRTPETYPLEGESEDIEARLSYLGLWRIRIATSYQNSANWRLRSDLISKSCLRDFLTVKKPLHTVSFHRHSTEDWNWDRIDLLIV
jgi:hypothetical protein